MHRQLKDLVRQRRLDFGWTKSDLARAVGSSPSRISKLEAGDPSVAANLMLKALAAMECPLRIVMDRAQDPFAQPRLSREQRHQLAARLLRRKCAEHIAKRHRVDAGDVEHVLYNLTLPPWQRLERSFRRAGLKRLSAR